MDTMRETLIRNTVLTGMALVFTGLTRIAYNIVIGKSYDADILGQVNLVLSITMLLSMVASLAFENSSTKFLSEFTSHADRESIFTLLFKWSIIASSLLVIAAYVFRDYVISQVKVDSDLYLIGLPLILVMAAYHFYRGCLYGLDLVDRYIKFEIVSTILFFLALAGTAYLGRWKLLLPFLLYYGLFSFFGMVSLRAYFRPGSGSFDGSKDIGVYGIIALIGTMASMSKAYIANIFTGIYLSPEQVGFYSAAVSITAILLYSPTIMGRVLLPTMSSSYGEGDACAIRKLLDLTTLWLSLISLFLGFIFIILSEDILVILFKPEFSEATLSLQMLILGLCLSTIIVPSVSALSGTKFVKIPNAAGVIGLFISLSLWPILIPRFGINGTAIGYIAGSACTSIIILYYATKYYDLSLKKTYLAIASCSLIFAASCLPNIILERHSNWIAAGIFIFLFLLKFKREIYEIYRKFRFKS